MTNKPMLSVEREVVEGICNDFEAGRHLKACQGAAKLRTLLDKPETDSTLDGKTHLKKLEWYKSNYDSMWASEGWPESWRKDTKFALFAARPVGSGEWDWICDIPTIYRKRCLEAFKAGERSVVRQAKRNVLLPEIDPDFEVWWLGRGKVSSSPKDRELAVDGFRAAIDAVARINDTKIAAQHQPAPVADHTQREECKGWGYHENHHEGGGTECGECGGSGNASVAVFMPDVDELAQIIRKVDGSHNLGAGSLAEAILEEVARLNGLKT